MKIPPKELSENDQLRAKLNVAEKYIYGYETRINALLVDLASLQSRLAAYEEGFDPKVDLPKNYRVVYIRTESETKVSRLYPALISGYFGGDCFEDLDGKHDEIKDVIRWFPLPGSKGGEE